jgi:maltooligosyltrehalose synthase
LVAANDQPHCIAFLRQYRRQAMLVVVPRFCSGLVKDEGLCVDTARLSKQPLRSLPAGPWRCALTGAVRSESPRDATELLGPAPFAIWHTDNI